jgi:hypothetical protein
MSIRKLSLTDLPPFPDAGGWLANFEAWINSPPALRRRPGFDEVNKDKKATRASQCEECWEIVRKLVEAKPELRRATAHRLAILVQKEFKKQGKIFQSVPYIGI